MKKHYLLTSLLFLLLIGFPLRSTLYAQEKGQQPVLQNRLGISLLKWLDPVNPGIDLAWERMTGSRRSVQFNIGFMQDPIHITPFEHYRGFAGGIERKWYKAEKKKNIHPYYALSLGYFRVKYNDQGLFNLNNTTNYEDTFSIDKTIYNFCGKAGWQIRSNRFFMDLSWGLGFKYKSTQRSGVNNPGAMEIKPIDPNVYYSASKPGKSILPTIPVNIRFGVMF